MLDIVTNFTIKLSNFFCPWDENRAKEILDYVVARISKYDEFDNEYYLYLYDFENFNKKIVPFYNRRFVKKYFYKIYKLLISDMYQIEGYKKDILESVGDKYICFTKI